MLQAMNLMRMLLIVVLGMGVAGCEVVGGIFKAGIWVGALAVILIVLLLAFIVVKIKK